MTNITKLIETVFEDMANILDVSKDAVKQDFEAFNNAIDKLIKEENLTEDEAISRVVSIWNYDFNK